MLLKVISIEANRFFNAKKLEMMMVEMNTYSSRDRVNLISFDSDLADFIVFGDFCLIKLSKVYILRDTSIFAV